MNELPRGWTLATLPDLVSKDGVFSDGDWVETKDQDPGGGVRLTQLADIGDGFFRDRSNRFMTAEVAERLSCTYLEPGDVLVARMPDPLGRACLYPGGRCPAVTAVDVCILRPGSGSVDARWLMWWLNTPQFRKEVGARQSGTTRKRISRKNLAAIEFPVAPLAEQRRIVAAIEEQLSRLDAASSVLRQGRQRSRNLRRAILARAVTEGEERPLGDLLDGIEAGRSFGGPGRPAAEHEWGVIKVSAMTWGRFKPGENKTIPAEDADPRWEIRSGDLLVSRANTTELVGAAVLVGETRSQLLLSDKSLRLVVKPQVDKSWLLNALSAPQSRRQISEVASGTSDSMRNISQDKLRAVMLRVPNPRRQVELACEITSELERVAVLDHALLAVGRRTEQLRSAILARAFRGEFVPQDMNDEPASMMLKRIAAERAVALQRTSRPVRRVVGAR